MNVVGLDENKKLAPWLPLTQLTHSIGKQKEKLTHTVNQIDNKLHTQREDTEHDYLITLV